MKRDGEWFSAGHADQESQFDKMLFARSIGRERQRQTLVGMSISNEEVADETSSSLRGSVGISFRTKFQHLARWTSVLEVPEQEKVYLLYGRALNEEGT